MPLKRWTPAGHGGVFAVFMLPQCSPCVGRISPQRVHTPPQLLTAHTAAHTPKHGGFSGSMVTMFSAAGSSTPSTLFRQIRRSPLLLRKDTVMPFLLRASTLFRIRWEKLLGVSPSAPAGSIFSNSTLAGALLCCAGRSKRPGKSGGRFLWRISMPMPRGMSIFTGFSTAGGECYDRQEGPREIHDPLQHL